MQLSARQKRRQMGCASRMLFATVKKPVHTSLDDPTKQPLTIVSMKGAFAESLALCEVDEAQEPSRACRPESKDDVGDDGCQA
ncbi:MAG: hypothetical protein BWY17_03438 [Deltaproteobacteria bacterium ADurb.Bin207]|jgi:hypothetical protein|nr:MAG: hypothetical protein BWY17_03438 [Deltaproteobacteria bacterium ADurb.Bin207]